MNNLDDYIAHHLRPHDYDFFTPTEMPPDYEVEWLFDPDEAVPPMSEAPRFPRVVPPERRNHPSVRGVPMAHDGGPGLRDGRHASRIKYMLREWL